MAGYIGSKAVNLSTTGADINGDANIDGDLSFGDNDKAIFGAGSDLQIYHNGINSFIADSGTGGLTIRSNLFTVQNAAGNETVAQFVEDGFVKLFHNNSQVFTTTSGGASITGSLGIGTSSPSADLDVASSNATIHLTDTDDTTYAEIRNNGGTFTIASDEGAAATNSSINLRVDGSEAMRIDSSGRVGINLTPSTSDPLTNVSAGMLQVNGNMELRFAGSNSDPAGPRYFNIVNTDTTLVLDQPLGGLQWVGLDSSNPNSNMASITSYCSGNTGTTGDIRFKIAASEAMRIDASGNLGIGTQLPEALLDVAYNLPDDTNGVIRPLKVRTTDTANETNLVAGDGVGILFEIADQTTSSIGASIDAVKTGGADDDSSTDLVLRTSANNETLNEAMRIDSSGNLLVGTTDSLIWNEAATDNSKEGVVIEPRSLQISRYQDTQALFNRQGNDGKNLVFAKDGSTVGSIGTSGGYFFINGGNSGGTHSGLRFINNASIRPCNTTGNNLDNTLDLGSSTARFDDIYATNGTIQTSDRNEKQDIAELSDAEQRVAVAAKGLMRKFRWRDAVAEKGDEARTHFGVIAQDLQAAFAAEGLDAGNYAMFISSTWWETQTEVPAVEAVAEVLDEDGNVVTEAVEAVDAYTRTDTYDTQEEAPEGATERTRLGVRYSELLAFIIGAL